MDGVYERSIEILSVWMPLCDIFNDGKCECIFRNNMYDSVIPRVVLMVMQTCSLGGMHSGL